MGYKRDNPDGLLPSFRPRVLALEARMVTRGFQPVLFDALRTPAEAARNARLGTGKANSIHCYGAAADFICDLHGWSCAKHGCHFFSVLGEEAEALGLVWGGRWKRVDQPHVQAIPATSKVQDALRALGMRPESIAARDAFVARFLRP